MATSTTTYQITTNEAELNKIDKLRECGVSQYIALPQLVVVGDQSSGKSSVLEALTKLPFPRNSQLCTTFPTQITFRNSSVQNTVVSIIPAPSAGSEKRARLREYKKDSLSAFTGDEFKEILKEVRTVMGIRDPESPEENTDLPTFSGDILKIELSGPGRQNLSIIDTPGIFRRQVEGRTKSSDMYFVREMASAYIKDKRTIILAVLPAGEDEENWEILSMAQKADPEGIRTLGVLTKPDLIDPGTEKRVMSFVRGEKSPLQLGYYVLRNRGKLQDEASPEERDEAEREFFAQDPWSSLDPAHVGVESLRKRLQELLVEITKRELPLVKRQINERLQKCRKTLESMGVDRTTTVQQQLYLHGKAAEFQKITDNALDAYYARNKIFTEIPGTRLPTLFMNRSEKYSSDMANKGYTISFTIKEDNEETPSIHEHEDEQYNEEGSLDTEDEMSNSLDGQYEIGSFKEMNEVGATNSGTTILCNHHPELSGLFQDDWVIEIPEDRCILKWIEEEYRGSRGSSLEPISPAILSTLWQEQSKNWRGLTMEYLADMIAYVHDFICKVLDHVFPEKRTSSSLMAILSDKLVDQYKIAIKQVEFITKVEKCGMLFTSDPIFQEDLNKFRLERLNEALSSISIRTLGKVRFPDGTTTEGTLVRLEDIMSFSPKHGIDNAVDGIYCILRAYYRTACTRYVDSICTQGVGHHLLNGAESPLRIFSPIFVASLTPEKLEDIAGEARSSKEKRQSLNKEIKSLEEGRDILLS